MFDDQSAYRARFEWGEAGVRRLARRVDVVVVVDVLRFTTAVEVAVGRGATVYPARRDDADTAAFAARIGATLATRWTADATNGSYSLSPASLLTIPPGTRLVLPSPNGATLALLAAEAGATVLAGCLRNAAATGAACRALGQTVAVVAAGERWRDAGDANGTLRPAVEDLVGAGAILAALAPDNPSPEAAAAIAAFRAATPDLGGFLSGCASGRELRERGLDRDVELAAEVDVSSAVAWLDGEAFAAWGVDGGGGRRPG